MLQTCSGETNQINALVVALNRNKVSTNSELKNNTATLMGCINRPVPIHLGWDAFKKAINIHNTLHALSLNITNELENEFKQAFNRREIITPPYRINDLERITESYDALSRAKRDIAKRSQALLELIQRHDHPISCPSIVIGAGDNGITLWLEKFHAHHESAKTAIEHGLMPPVLVLAENFGAWGRTDYLITQSVGLLERPGEANPADFISEKTYNNPKTRVNARHLEQANQIIRANSGMPILQSKVTSIEKKDRHLDDWFQHHPPFEYRLKIELNEKPDQIHTLYTNHIDVCAGFGKARNPFPALLDETHSESKKMHEKLTQPNQSGFKPLISGNDFLLNDNENQTLHENRRILIVGSGGTGAAAFRKAALLTDKGHTFGTLDDKNSPNTNIRWIAQYGFLDVKLSALASESVSWGKSKGLLSEGKLIRIAEHSNQLEATFTMYQRINGGHALNSDELKQTIHELTKTAESAGNNSFSTELVLLDNIQQYVIVKTESIICDQIVAAIGQDSSLMRTQFLTELGTLEATIVDGITTGIHSEDDQVHFYGATAVALADKAIKHKMQRELNDAHAPQDAALPGIMPTSRELIRLSHFTKKNNEYLRSLNVNTVHPKCLAAILQQGGLSAIEIEAFIAFILTERQSTSAGITRTALNAYFSEHPYFSEKVTIIGHTNIAIKPVDVLVENRIK